MTPQDRAAKKQLLVMKGEALRVKLRLEKEQLCRHPLGAARAGWESWTDSERLGKLAASLGSLLPSSRLQRWLKTGARAWLAWRLLRRWMA
ncbi:hypothetical protein CEK28_11840 [Xenophilus sp. AP218F]|nr:hypothetical protein CEK28_11840 [Xenophilus sp. AP218F]